MPDRPENYHVIHLWVDLTRTLQQLAAPENAHFGTGLGDLLIRSAIYIGTVEARPMSPSKISDYIGVPRGTVIRRLRVLEARGLVEKAGAAYRTPAARLKALADMHDAAQLVHAGHERLRQLTS